MIQQERKPSAQPQQARYRVHVGTWRTRGISAHTTIIVDIIDTMLIAARVSSASSLNREKEGAHTGWRLTIPNFDASKPVRNGSTAEPAWPTLAI